jgi:hypothetical protein
VVREVSLDIIVEVLVELVEVWSVVEEVVVLLVVEFRNLPRVCFAGAAVEAVAVEAAAGGGPERNLPRRGGGAMVPSAFSVIVSLLVDWKTSIYTNP